MRFSGYAIAILLFSFFIRATAQAKEVFPPEQDTTIRVLRQIIISGKTHTKSAVILRELSVQQGDILPSIELSELAQLNTQRLYTISIFNEVKIHWQFVGSDSVDMMIWVADRFPVMPEGDVEFADRNFNVWWKEQNHNLRRINLGLTLTDNNFRGNLENLSVSGQAGYTQKIGIGYSRPYIDKNQKHGFGVSFFGLQNREIAYNTIQNKLAFYRDESNYMLRRSDAGLWYTYRPRYAVTHTLLFTWQHYWISGAAAALNPEYLGEGMKQADNLWLQYRLEWNRVDNWNYPLIGQRLIGVLDEKYLLPSHKFQTGFYLQMDRYFHPFPNWYAAIIFRGRVSFPAMEPYIFRQNLGYDFDYVRGFEYYVIDGSAFALGRVDIKRCLINYKIRLPVRYFEEIPIRLYAKVYGDIGTSYNKMPENDFLNNRLLCSGGLGLDIVTLYDIKLRIEYTINNFGQNGLFLHKSGE